MRIIKWPSFHQFSYNLVFILFHLVFHLNLICLFKVYSLQTFEFAGLITFLNGLWNILHCTSFPISIGYCFINLFDILVFFKPDALLTLNYGLSLALAFAFILIFTDAKLIRNSLACDQFAAANGSKLSINFLVTLFLYMLNALCEFTWRFACEIISVFSMKFVFNIPFVNDITYLYFACLWSFVNRCFAG